KMSAALLLFSIGRSNCERWPSHRSLFEACGSTGFGCILSGFPVSRKKNRNVLQVACSCRPDLRHPSLRANRTEIANGAHPVAQQQDARASARAAAAGGQLSGERGTQPRRTISRLAG